MYNITNAYIDVFEHFNTILTDKNFKYYVYI